MASKKKPSDQLGFFTLPPTQSTAPVPVNPNHLAEGAAVVGRVKEPIRDPSLPPSKVREDSATRDTTELKCKASAAGLDLESFDDYDDSAKHEDVLRLHLVDPPAPSPRVIVESVGEVFEVSRLRDGDTTVACVMWTRSELEELSRRITAALEMSE